jgi:hypothetical protein
MSCIDPKYNCGVTIPSSCVPLQTNVEFTSFDKSDLSCNPNINELFHKFDSIIKSIQDSIDLTQLDKKTLIFDKNVIKPKDLFQLLISTISDLRTRVAELEARLNALDLLTQEVNIDLSCLGIASCDDSNKHSVLFILTTLVDAYCELKNSNN